MVTMYVGSATKVVTGAPGATSRSSGRWSVRPEFVVSWAAGVAQSAVPQTGAVAYDGDGNVIGTYAFGT